MCVHTHPWTQVNRYTTILASTNFQLLCVQLHKENLVSLIPLTDLIFLLSHSSYEWTKKIQHHLMQSCQQSPMYFNGAVSLSWFLSPPLRWSLGKYWPLAARQRQEVLDPHDSHMQVPIPPSSVFSFQPDQCWSLWLTNVSWVLSWCGQGLADLAPWSPCVRCITSWDLARLPICSPFWAISVVASP